MSSQLDPSILAAITQEARQCFLDEDAPEYLAILESAFKKGDRPDVTSLLRATHSLKGGAGLASLSNLQHLAHKLEDVLVSIQQGQVTEPDFGWALVERSIDEVSWMLTKARTTDDVPVDLELVTALEKLANNASNVVTEPDIKLNTEIDRELVRTTLTEDLENTFKSIEEIADDASTNAIAELITDFIDECQFFSETLDLPWLAAATAPLNSALAQSPATEVLALAKEIISHLRSQREAYLNNDSAREIYNDNLVTNALTLDLEESLAAIDKLADDTPLSLIEQFAANLSDECSFWGETLDLPWLVEAVAPLEDINPALAPEAVLTTLREVIAEIRQLRDLYLQDSNSALLASLPSNASLLKTETQPQLDATQLNIPVAKIKDITSNVEELILIQSRLSRQQKLLNQADRRLRSLDSQFELISEQIRDFYDRLTLNSTKSISSQTLKRSATDTTDPDCAFDYLELDRYTELHTSLQSVRELMLSVGETRKDIEIIERELAEDLEQNYQKLEQLYDIVDEARLVPFQFLARRFIPQIQKLNRRFGKSVNLEIIGENTPVDRVLLEKLQTPLTHLINNAFDHGIESTTQRLANGKSASARIVLEVSIENDRLQIFVRDDGAGIDIERVYQRAVEKGICPRDKSREQLQREEIINWIFEPDFSTASSVSDISGRGMGLDTVRSKIRQFKGNLLVQTELGVGTTFTIDLPLNLSWRSLLLVELQDRTIAIPQDSVIEVLPYSELEFSNAKEDAVCWQEQTIPVISLAELLPYPRQPLQLSRAEEAIVVRVTEGLLVILVDAISSKEKLIIKPFDDTIPVPSYLSGCAVLATGELIPLLSPQELQVANAAAKAFVKPIAKNNTPNNLTILVAEDSIATRKMLEKVLIAVGYRVIVCRDGREALDCLEGDRATVDVIISDVEMPRVNGFELLQQVRSHAVYQNIPIIMVTSRTGDRHRQQAIKLGATEYFGKPVQPQELLATIENLFKTRSEL